MSNSVSVHHQGCREKSEPKDLGSRSTSQLVEHQCPFVRPQTTIGPRRYRSDTATVTVLTVTDTLAYLIGGPPGGGKTTLGLHLATRLGCQSLTIDDIRTAFLAATTPESHPALHVIGLPDHLTYFTETSPDEMIEHAIAQHSVLWPAVERVLRKRLVNDQAIVVDGWHLLPHLIAESDLSGATPVWIDVGHDVLEKRERAVWDFYARSNDPDRMFANFLARSTRWNDRMASEARELGFVVVSQDGSKSVEDLAKEVVATSAVAE